MNTLNLEANEKAYIKEALKRAKWNKRMAAKLLGIHERTLYNKINSHNLKEER